MKEFIKEIVFLSIMTILCIIILKILGLSGLVTMGITVGFFSLIRIEQKLDKLLKSNTSIKDLDDYIDNLKE